MTRGQPRRTSLNRRPVLCALAASLALASAPRAHAQEHPPLAPPPPETPEPAALAGPEPVPGRWYGWQIALSDVAAAGSIAAASTASGPGQTGGSLLSGGAALLYYGGGASIHFAHGRPGLAGRSFLMRLLLPPGLGLLGYFADGGGRPSGSETYFANGGGGLLAGLAFGTLLAVGIDWTTARETAAVGRAAEAGTSDPPLAWGPTLAVGRRAARVGLALRF